MADKTFSSVASLVESFGESTTSQALKEQMARRRVVSTLQAMRVSKDLSQMDLAAALGCTQSRISKLESGDDSDLKLSDIEGYARALDCSVNLVFANRRLTAVDRVKGYASLIRAELRKIAKHAHKDERIAKAVSHFLGEALYNLVELVREASSELPPNEDGEPRISIKQLIDDPCDNSLDESRDCTETLDELAAAH